MAEPEGTKLRPGDPAPGFELLDQHGNTVQLRDYRGQKLLIYFYPKADTPGCTAQSCQVRDSSLDLKELHLAVVGISPDTPEEQAAFDEKFSLGFPLLADEGGEVAQAYGVWGEPFGPGWKGVFRSSFLVDEAGKIEQAWYNVAPTDTVPKAIEALV
jgi:thioredoxin-dependent peroxiredoxin